MKRGLGVVVALAGLGLVLTACGSSRGAIHQAALPGGRSPSAVISLAAQSTEAAGSAHFVWSAASTLQGISVKVSGEGDIAFNPLRGDMTVTFGDSLASFFPEGAAISTIITGNEIYLKTPGSSKWLSLPLPQAAAALGNPGQGLLMPFNLAKFLRQLGASAQVSDLGTTTLNGERVEHYRVSGTFNPSSLNTTVGPLNYSFDVYVAGDMVVSLDGMVTGSSGLSVNLSCNLSNFGEPVNVSAPPASEVAPLSLPGWPTSTS